MYYNDYEDHDKENEMDEKKRPDKVKNNDQEDMDRCNAECVPPCMCEMMGMKIMRSAVEFENTLASYLRCQCKIIKCLIRAKKFETLEAVMKSSNDSLHQIFNIETQIIGKLETGACLSNCIEPEG